LEKEGTDFIGIGRNKLVQRGEGQGRGSRTKLMGEKGKRGCFLILSCHLWNERGEYDHERIKFAQ